MSIEQENLNSESSLDQYGVWVKKSPTNDNAQQTDELDIIDIVDSDFDSQENDIFFDAEDSLSEDFDIEFTTPKEIEDEIFGDDLDSTLTTDELMNITNDIKIEESNDFDMDFDKLFDDIKDDFFESKTSVEDFTGFTTEETEPSEADVTSMFEDSETEELSIGDFMETSSEEHLDNTLDTEIIFEETINYANNDEIFDNEDEISPTKEEVNFGEEISLDDIDIFGDEEVLPTPIETTEKVQQDYSLSIEPVTEEPKEIEQAAETITLGNDILMKIMSELSNIRNEMNEFRTELANIKNEKSNTVAEEILEEVEEEKVSGFFSDFDDDDEIIALSGDELNNILTSADFTTEEETSIDDFIIPAENDVNTIIQEPIAETIAPVETTEEPKIIEDVIDSEDDESKFDDFEYLKTVENETTDVHQNEIDELTIIDAFRENHEEVATEIEESSANTVLEDSLEDNYLLNTETEEENNAFTIEEELVEPSLDDINFDIDDDSTSDEEIDIPVIEDMVVKSSQTSFFDDDEELDDSKDIDDSAMRYLADEPQEESLVEEPENDVLDEVEIEANVIDEVTDSEEEFGLTEPVNTVFDSDQWSGETEKHESGMNSELQEEIKSILTYMDRLLENLPEEKISEFAKSDYFDRYKKLFSDLGIS